MPGDLSPRAPRSELVSVRLSPEEHSALVAEAAALGISVSDLIRRACAAEVDILRRQRAIREEERRRRLLPQGQSFGNPVSIGVTYVN